MKPKPTPDDDYDDEVSIGASSFKEIILKHQSRITLLYSKELRGGYYTMVTNRKGETKEAYVEDTREALSNAILCLTQLLILKFDGEMNKAIDEFNKEVSDIEKEFLESSSIEEDVVLGESFYGDDDKILLERYKIKKLALYQGLFTEICKLLLRLKYFEISGGIY